MARIRSLLAAHKDTVSLLGCLCLYMAVTQLLGITCMIKEFTGISCPGCGMTRALLSLLRLDFDAAVYYHPLVFALLPTAAALVFFQVRKQHTAKRVLIGAAAAVLLAVYVYRMLCLPSAVMEFAPENGLAVRLWTRFGSLFR